MTQCVLFIGKKMGQKVGQVGDSRLKNTLVPLSHTLGAWDSGTNASNPYPAKATVVPAPWDKRDNLQVGQKMGQVGDKGTNESPQTINYSEKLSRLSAKSPVNKQKQTNVALPIPDGFDLPDRAKTLRAAYDLWQPVRDVMPEWVAYMSVRKAHQNGDKSLEKAHQEAEQAYYAACQQCPAFQYYRQVHQQLFPSRQEKLIDWYAEPREASL